MLRRTGVEVHIVSVRAWRSLPAALLRYVDALRIARLAGRRRVELVHASDLWKSGYMHFAARRLGVPSVLHIRGPVSGRDVVKHGVARSSAVITIARRYHQDLLAEGIPSDRLHLIDDAVDVEQFRPDAAAREAVRKRLGLADRLCVGIIGRIDPFKRVIEFLEMIAPLARDERGGAAYLVIGQPGRERYQRAVLEAARRLGLTERVVFTGRWDDVAAIIAALDIVVTMSGGSVMFEAMACAKPVLSVRADARPSVHTRHDETAWCVTTSHPAPATAALARLMDEPDLRERLGRAARAWVEQHLTCATMVARTQAVYESLLGR